MEASGGGRGRRAASDLSEKDKGEEGSEEALAGLDGVAERDRHELERQVREEEAQRLATERRW